MPGRWWQRAAGPVVATDVAEAVNDKQQLEPNAERGHCSVADVGESRNTVLLNAKESSVGQCRSLRGAAVSRSIAMVREADAPLLSERSADVLLLLTEPDAVEAMAPIQVRRRPAREEALIACATGWLERCSVSSSLCRASLFSPPRWFRARCAASWKPCDDGLEPEADVDLLLAEPGGACSLGKRR